MGLAAHLLGLESELHISRDPLRGNLFENMVVMEALKYRLHRGRRSNLHFYRDSNGNEVDLLLNYGPDLFPVEVKAGMTVNKDYFKGLQAISRVFDLPLGAGLIYGGEEVQRRHNINVQSVRTFHLMLADKEVELAQ